MAGDVLIVGQGLAGTLLGWAFERAGIAFAIADRGSETTATAAAAGIIAPITGRRLTRSWRIESLLPQAKAAYREIEAALGVPLWREMRMRRLFADDRERAIAHERMARGEWVPFVTEVDEAGVWFEGAARIELAVLIDASRQRWQAAGRSRAAVDDLDAEATRHELVIDCRGLAGALSGEFGFVPWEFSKGEVLELAVDGLEPGVVLNRRQWIVPVGPGAAWTGATHEPGQTDASPTPAARQRLEAGARELAGPDRPLTVTGHRAGVRVTLPDRRPIAGRHPDRARLGLVNGLGAKGALWAPMLARAWVAHLSEGAPFDAEVEVRRFG